MNRLSLTAYVLAMWAAACGGNTVGITVGATGAGVSVAAAGATGSASGTTAAEAASAGPTSSGASTSGLMRGETTGATSTSSASTSGSGSTIAAAGTTGSSSGAASGTTTGSTGASSSGCVPTTELMTGCGSDSDCDCGLLCVTDPAFGNDVTACEYACTDTGDCPNAVSVCSANGLPVDGSSTETCTLNVCAGLRDNPGDACDAYGDGGASGTCIPQSRTYSTLESTPDALLCVQNGIATTCEAGINDDDPEFSNDSTEIGTDLTIASPFPRDPSDLCLPGAACNAAYDAGAGPECQAVCSTSGQNCASGSKCIASDSSDTSWGFCGACVPSGGSCLIDTDCCGTVSCGIFGSCD